MIILENLSSMAEYVGKEIGISKWHCIDQDRVDAFADITGDHTWIHVDVNRAKEQMPDGKTIVHGLLTLSLIPQMVQEIWKIAQRGRGLNYGYNRVRFTRPLPVGSRVRLRQTIISVLPKDGGTRIISECIIDREGEQYPVLVAEMIVLIYEV